MRTFELRRSPILLLVAVAMLACDSGRQKPDPPSDDVTDTSTVGPPPAAESVPDTFTQPPRAPSSGGVDLSHETGRIIARNVGLFNIKLGDSLNYRARWPRFVGATSHRVGLRTVASSGNNAKWTHAASGKLLPTTVNVADTSLAFVLIDTLAWDSTSFRLVVWGINSAGVSRDSITTTWKVSRVPTAPGGQPSIDSSAVKYSRVILRPDVVKLAPSSEECKLATRKVDSAGTVLGVCKEKASMLPMVVQFCPFLVRTVNGRPDPWYYFMGGYDTKPECRAFYMGFPAANRPPAGYPTPYPVAFAHRGQEPDVRIAVNIIAVDSITGHQTVEAVGTIVEKPQQRELISTSGGWDYYIDHQMPPEVGAALMQAAASR